MTRIWLAAVLFCLAGIVTIVYLPSGEVAVSRSERFEYAIRNLDPLPDLIVLGSSLSSVAVPPQMRLDAEPGSGAPALTALRIALPCTQPQELARLLELATSRGVSVILFEINHFLYDLKSCHPERGLRARLGDFVLFLRWRIKWAIYGTDSALAEAAYESTFLKQIYDGDESRLRRDYRISLRPPEAFGLLEPVLAAGRKKGLRVILVVLPRSETASRFLGTAFNSGLDTRIADIRDRFANMVWEPARSWPDRYFADQGHMNRAGRERFMAALARIIGEVR